jgi:hypothetical protein
MKSRTPICLYDTVIANFKARRRFRNMKIYCSKNTPQIVKICQLAFTFGPENQTMCLRLPFRTVC